MNQSERTQFNAARELLRVAGWSIERGSKRGEWVARREELHYCCSVGEIIAWGEALAQG